MCKKKKKQELDKEQTEAEERYKNSYKDPFPAIAPALLNSADIRAYVKTTGMICPFHEDDLQSASYKVRIGGKVVYYQYPEDSDKVTKKPEPVKVDLDKEGKGFDLLPNSIAFVTLEPYFRIPQYIALRFNLKIKHVYKGLLLGTGPLVDPGFKGKLSIPLHNLTNNTYHFNYGDTLITMEFTKLSHNKEWSDSSYDPGHSEEYIKEEIKPGRDVNQYIANALKEDRLTTVVSSIPSALNESKNQAVQAQKEAKKISRRSFAISIATFLAILSLVISVATLAINAINKANDRYDDMSRQYYEKLKEYDDKLTQVESEYKAILDELQNNAPTQSSGIAPNP